MLVIPPGLSEEEEALQKKFNKLKKKVRGLGWWGSLSQTLRMPGAGVRRRGSPGSYPEYTSSRRNFPSIVFSAQSPMELWSFLWLWCYLGAGDCHHWIPSSIQSSVSHRHPS